MRLLTESHACHPCQISLCATDTRTHLLAVQNRGRCYLIGTDSIFCSSSLEWGYSVSGLCSNDCSFPSCWTGLTRVLRLRIELKFSALEYLGLLLQVVFIVTCCFFIPCQAVVFSTHKGLWTPWLALTELNKATEMLFDVPYTLQSKVLRCLSALPSRPPCYTLNKLFPFVFLPFSLVDSSSSLL